MALLTKSSPKPATRTRPAPDRNGRKPARDAQSPAPPARRRGRRKTFLGLDIGTTKVCAIIAEAGPDGSITILGLGSSPSRGMRRGVVTDIDHTVSAIHEAYERARDLAHITPSAVYIGIAGDHICGIDVESMVEVANPNVGIDDRDCKQVIRKALQITMPPDVDILYHVVREFIVNGTGGIHNPVGLFGQRLEVKAHVITSSIAASNNLCRCVKKSGLRTSGIVLQSLASSLATLNKRERELGVILVDIGGGTTDIAVFADDVLQYTAEISYGGDSITQDIAIMLRCSPHDAENLKKKFANANPLNVDAEEKVDLPSPTREGQRVSYYRRELAEITEARVEEIFFHVKKVILRSGLKDRIYAGVILTGGTALLDGIGEVAERILEYPTRVGRPEDLRGLGEVASSPIYSTAVGLIKWAVEEGPGHQRENFLIRKIKEVFDIYG
jgi:cell division protein FtsA